MRINLKEILGINVSGNEDLKRAFGEAVLNRILERTADRTSRTGSRFKNYSNTYKESLEFKAAGKSVGNPNLRLSGDMLGLLRLRTPDGTNTIELGWDDDEQAAKAHGHITGAKGKLPVRDFLGLPANELNDIRKRFSSEISDIKSSRGENRRSAINNLISRIESEFGDGEN